MFSDQPALSRPFDDLSPWAMKFATTTPLVSDRSCTRAFERPLWRGITVVFAIILGQGLTTPSASAWDLHFEQRNSVGHLLGPYNSAFFYRHNASFRYSAGFHFHHGKEHDILQLTPFGERERVDAQFDRNVFEFVKEKKAYTEPTMELYGQYVGRMAWRVYRAIDWTHMHHEQTYDILSDAGIPWEKKKEWTDRAVAYYLKKNPVARSVAPLDVTMRRAAVMMKPYFTYYRNYWPQSNSQAWVAHWWHPVIYEALMIAGNGPAQEEIVGATNATMFDAVYPNRPKRMLLSRELMPRYSRMSPESANIFDNLHMLHGIVYDILAYPDWTEKEKRDELYRFIDAMSYRSGDEKLARKFRTPHPNVDPRVYEPWMVTVDGEMSRIMKEMMDEMMPMMMPQGMSTDRKAKVMAQFKMKMTPGEQPGEIFGSLHDAMMALMPEMTMDPDSVEAGKTPTKMVEVMLSGWERKYGDMTDIPPWPMETELHADMVSK